MAQKTTTEAKVSAGKVMAATMATESEGRKTISAPGTSGLRKRPATIAGETMAPMGAPTSAPQKRASGTRHAAAAMPMVAPAVMENVTRQPARDADSRVSIWEGMGRGASRWDLWVRWA